MVPTVFWPATMAVWEQFKHIRSRQRDAGTFKTDICSKLLPRNSEGRAADSGALFPGSRSP